MAERIEIEVGLIQDDGHVGQNLIENNESSDVLGNHLGCVTTTTASESPPELLTVSEFQHLYLTSDERPAKNFSVAHKLRRCVKGKCKPSCILRVLYRTFPVLSMLQTYNVKTELVSDLVAGLSVGIVQIPSSMAFAMLAALPPICGLYTAFISAMVYFLFGTSRYVSVGTTATVSLVVGTAVENNADYFKDSIGFTNFTTNSTLSEFTFEAHGHKVAAAATLTFLVGSILVVLGKLRCGIVTSYMPDPMLGGFLTSAMLLVIISQLKVVLGLKIAKQAQPFKCIKELIEIGKNVSSTSVASLVSSSICFLILYIVKVCVNERYKDRLLFPVPIELIVLVIATTISHFTDLNGKFGLEIVGDIPSSLPPPHFPPIQKTNSNLIRDAVTVAVVAYVISVSIAKSMAKKTRDRVSSNQEMVAVGASSLVSSLFSGFAVGVSLSRSMVQRSAGGKSQIASLAGSFVVLLVILSIGPLFFSLPISVLAAIILVAFKGVVSQLQKSKGHWNVSKYDFTMWFVTFIGVLFFGVDIGLCLGVLTSLLSVTIRSQRSQVLNLGKIHFSSIYMPSEQYKCDERQQWKKLVYFEGPLYFANAEQFVKRFRTLNPPPTVHKGAIAKTGESSGKSGKACKCCCGTGQGSDEMHDTSASAPPSGGPSSDRHNHASESSSSTQGSSQYIIVDCSGITFSDSTGVAALAQLISDYESDGVTILLAGMRDDVIVSMQKCGYWEQLSELAFMTVRGADDYTERRQSSKV